MPGSAIQRRRGGRWSGAAVGAIALVVLSACGGEPSASPATTTTSTSSATASEPATTFPSATTVGPATTAVPVGPATTATTSTPTATATVPATTSTVQPSAPIRSVPIDRPLRVMIIGDSVAMTMTSSIRETHDVEGYGAIEVLNLGNLACPVIEEGEWWFTAGIDLDVPGECAGPGRYESEIEAFRPDVVYTLFGWTGGGGGQRLPDGSLVAPCDPEFDERWRDGYQRLVDRLERRAIVVISTVAPADIDDAAQRRPTRCLNTVVAQLDATVFDYGEWLCPDDDCSVSRDLRADRVHFTDDEPLRRDVVRAVLAQVLPIAGY